MTVRLDASSRSRRAQESARFHFHHQRDCCCDWQPSSSSSCSCSCSCSCVWVLAIKTSDRYHSSLVAHMVLFALSSLSQPQPPSQSMDQLSSSLLSQSTTTLAALVLPCLFFSIWSISMFFSRSKWDPKGKVSLCYRVLLHFLLIH